MKKILGLCFLVILLVAVSGCAQQAQPPKTTPAPTTVETTVTTPEPTPVPTTVATTIPTQIVTPIQTATAVATAATTAPVVANVTSESPGLVSTPKISMTPSTKVTVIGMSNGTFTPKELTVLPGTGITWRNDDTISHTVKGTTETGSTMFNSGEIVPGTTWSYTYGDRTGAFTVVDPGVPGMKCIIIVKEGSNFSGTFTY